MAEDVEIIKIKVDSATAEKQLEKARKDLQKVSTEVRTLEKEQKDLKKIIKETGDETGEYSVQLAKNQQQLRKSRSEQRQLTREIQAESGSLEQLRARLANLTRQRNQLNTGTREGAQEFNRLQKEIKETTGELQRLEQEGGDFRRNVGNYSSATKNLTKNFAALATGITAAIAGLATLVRSSRAAVEASNKQSQAEAQLLNALQGRSDIQQRLIEQAAETQGRTLFGDEEIIQQQAFLAALGLTEQQINDTIEASVQLSAATGQTLEGSVRNLAKTYGGLAGELGELVPGLRGLTQEQLRSGEAIAFVSEQFADTAETLAETGLGPFEQLQNTFGDIQENIGDIILSLGSALLPTLRTIASALETVSDVISKLSSNIREARRESETFNNILAGVTTGFQILADSAILAYRTIVEGGAAAGQSVRGLIDLIRGRGTLADITDPFTNFASNIADSAANLAETVRESFKDNLKIPPEEAKQVGESVGKSVGDGIINGIEGSIQQSEFQKRLAEAISFGNQSGLEEPAEDTPDEFLSFRLEGLIEESERELDIVEQTEEEKLRIKREYDKQQKRLQEELTKSIAEGEREIVSSFFGFLDSIAGENTALQKSIAAGQLLIQFLQQLGAIDAASAKIAAIGLPPASLAAAASYKTIQTILASTTFAGRLAQLSGAFEGNATGGRIGRSEGASIMRSNGDNRLITAKTGEVILNNSQRLKIGDSTLRKAGVPGFATGGVVTSEASATQRADFNQTETITQGLRNMAPVVRVSDINKVNNRVTVVDNNVSL